RARTPPLREDQPPRRTWPSRHRPARRPVNGSHRQGFLGNPRSRRRTSVRGLATSGPARGAACWNTADRSGPSGCLLSVSFQPLVYLERSIHVELAVHALLSGPEVAGRLPHGDHLGPVDLVTVPIGHNGRRAFVEDVLQPVGALAIREGDQ